MSGGEIAGLIAAGAFVLLVLLLAIPLLKLGRTLDEATLAIRKTHEGAVPLLAGAQTTLEQVNTQLEQVDGITKDVSNMTTNAAALTSIVSSTVGSPLIKVAAFSYGVRKTVESRRDASGRPPTPQRVTPSAGGAQLMRRLFWLVAGRHDRRAGRPQAHAAAEQFTPRGMAAASAAALADLAEQRSASSCADVRAAMREHEAELREGDRARRRRRRGVPETQAERSA